jgi:hypothetical protein
VIVYTGSVTMYNNTISQNRCTSTLATYGGGLCLGIGSTASGANNILYGNIAMAYPDLLGTVSFTHSCCSQAMTGTGNITSNPLFAAGPQGSFYLSQTAAGQAVNSPCVDAGNPASAMITGTTRTDEIQDAGIVDMGYHYPLPAGNPAVTIALTPVNPPIIIPPNGGVFNFNATLHNGESAAQTCEVWIMVQLPNQAWYGPVLGPITLNLPAGAQITRQRTQNIPASAPAGQYLYEGRVGDYPAAIWDSDGFNFTKSAVGDGGSAVGAWSCSGEDFPAQSASLPEDCLLLNNYPNPFNPTTTIRYTLPQAGRTTLAIFDCAGREAARLVDGWREAGDHQLTFDGTGMPSGVYFVKLQVGDDSAVRKMVMVK